VDGAGGGAGWGDAGDGDVVGGDRAGDDGGTARCRLGGDGRRLDDGGEAFAVDADGAVGVVAAGVGRSGCGRVLSSPAVGADGEGGGAGRAVGGGCAGGVEGLGGADLSAAG